MLREVVIEAWFEFSCYSSKSVVLREEECLSNALSQSILQEVETIRTGGRSVGWTEARCETSFAVGEMGSWHWTRNESEVICRYAEPQMPAASFRPAFTEDRMILMPRSAQAVLRNSDNTTSMFSDIAIIYLNISVPVCRSQDSTWMFSPEASAHLSLPSSHEGKRNEPVLV